MQKMIPGVSDKFIEDFGFFGEIGIFVLINMFLMRKCFYSFILESLAE